MVQGPDKRWWWLAPPWGQRIGSKSVLEAELVSAAVSDAGADINRNQSNGRMVGPLGEEERLPGPGLGEGPGVLNVDLDPC